MGLSAAPVSVPGASISEVHASRALATNYTNTTGKTMAVSVIASLGTTPYLNLTISGVVVNYAQIGNANIATVFGLVPPGGVYQVNASQAVTAWYEIT